MAAAFARRQDEEDTRSFNRFEVIASFAVMLLFEVLIYTILLQDTKLMSRTIDGVQGRYYIPLIPLIIALLRKVKIRCDIQRETIMRMTWFVYALNILYVMCVYLRR